MDGLELPEKEFLDCLAKFVAVYNFERNDDITQHEKNGVPADHFATYMELKYRVYHQLLKNPLVKIVFFEDNFEYLERFTVNLKKNIFPGERPDSRGITTSLQAMKRGTRKPKMMYKSDFNLLKKEIKSLLSWIKCRNALKVKIQFILDNNGNCMEPTTDYNTRYQLRFKSQQEPLNDWVKVVERYNLLKEVGDKNEDVRVGRRKM